MPNHDFSELSEIACDVITRASGIAAALAQDIERVAKDTDRDFWMSPEEAQEYGLVDAVQSSRTTKAEA